LTKTTLTETFVLVETDDIDFTMLRAAINMIAKTQYTFHDKVFKEPYTPYFDSYKGHTFVIDHASDEDETGNHVWLTCISDDSVKVAGYVHLDQLVIK
jgi:hypothetical protein